MEHLRRLYRKGDPATSLIAAASAMGEGLRSATIVLGVMQDGRARIDEEIANEAASKSGLSRTRFRHGRLVLLEAGMLLETGVTRHTSRGRPSREYILSTVGVERELQGELF